MKKSSELNEIRSRRWFAVWGILYKGTLSRNPRCSRCRRIDKADISTPVTEDQRAANCLEEAVWTFTARCRSSRTDITFRCPLPVFRCSSVHCFQTCIIVELFRCTRSPIARQENPPSRRPIILPRSNSAKRSTASSPSLGGRGCGTRMNGPMDTANESFSTPLSGVKLDQDVRIRGSKEALNELDSI
ncbi:uncharacterized protein TNCV_5139291 [Trichonephila clavipes]|nr:uncharacterized protein TNCV_5139291 [Trichonephila clavipes]